MFEAKLKEKIENVLKENGLKEERKNFYQEDQLN